MRSSHLCKEHLGVNTKGFQKSGDALLHQSARQQQRTSGACQARTLTHSPSCRSGTLAIAAQRLPSRLIRCIDPARTRNRNRQPQHSRLISAILQLRLLRRSSVSDWRRLPACPRRFWKTTSTTTCNAAIVRLMINSRSRCEAESLIVADGLWSMNGLKINNRNKLAGVGYADSKHEVTTVCSQSTTQNADAIANLRAGAPQTKQFEFRHAYGQLGTAISCAMRHSTAAPKWRKPRAVAPTRRKKSRSAADQMVEALWQIPTASECR